VAQVDVEEPNTQEAIVVAVKSQQDAMLDLMSKLVDRLERLKAQDSDPGDEAADRRRPSQVWYCSKMAVGPC